jgi:ABC-type transport system involved in multi-copper enzyme maturation permease subunit
VTWLNLCSLVDFFGTSPREKTIMVLAIVRKELRETRLFAALAVGVYLLYLSTFIGRWSRPITVLFETFLPMYVSAPDIPFVEDNFVSMFFFTGFPLAIALGFRQSAWEPSQGTALYLLHLPMARSTIFLAKVMTGIGLLLACTLLPIVLYATWAAFPGTHAGPFEWSMTGPAFHLWLLLPIAYLGAFASGIRPASWFGSRLLPLISVTVPGIFIYFLINWWLIGFPLLFFGVAILVSDILWEAETRDF